MESLKLLIILLSVNCCWCFNEYKSYLSNKTVELDRTNQCFNEYESFMNKLTVGLDLNNRKNDFEEKNNTYQSSEKGSGVFIEQAFLV